MLLLFIYLLVFPVYLAFVLILISSNHMFVFYDLNPFSYLFFCVCSTIIVSHAVKSRHAWPSPPISIGSRWGCLKRAEPTVPLPGHKRKMTRWYHLTLYIVLFLLYIFIPYHDWSVRRCLYYSITADWTVVPAVRQKTGVYWYAQSNSVWFL